MTTWKDWTPVAHCHHPMKDRYYPCEWVQKCGWCKEVRWSWEADELWLPVTKESHLVRDPRAPVT